MERYYIRRNELEGSQELLESQERDRPAHDERFEFDDPNYVLLELIDSHIYKIHSYYWYLHKAQEARDVINCETAPQAKNFIVSYLKIEERPYSHNSSDYFPWSSL